MKQFDDRNEYGVAMAKIRARRSMSMAVYARAIGYPAGFAWTIEAGGHFIDQSYLDNVAKSIVLTDAEIYEIAMAVKEARSTRELVDAFRRHWREIPVPLLDQIKAVVLPVDG